MHSLSIGPLALATTHVLTLLALLLMSWVGQRVLRRAAAGTQTPVPALDNGLWLALLLAVLVARLGFIARHLALYLQSPASWIDLRDGGYQPLDGLIAFIVLLLLWGWRVRLLRRPLLLGALAGALLWGGGWLAFGRHRDVRLPEVRLQDLQGRPVDLRRLAAGRPLVLNLWATWCPPCRRELPALVAAQQQRPQALIVLADQGESAAVVQAYLARIGLQPRDVLLDPRGELATQVGSSGLPTTLFYDAEGRLLSRYMGELSLPALLARLP
ncbi:MAG: hypothetical protein RJA44_2043 [Pseudomonadota bacterium]